MSQRKKVQGRQRKLKKLVYDNNNKNGPEHRGTLRRVWPASFLTLPRELRDQIYHLSLVPEDGKEINLHARPPEPCLAPFMARELFQETLEAACKDAERTFAMLRGASRQVGQEAAQTFYSANVFSVDTGKVGWSGMRELPLRWDVSRMRTVTVQNTPLAYQAYGLLPKAEVTLRLLRSRPTYTAVWYGSVQRRLVLMDGLDRIMAGKTERVGLTLSEFQQLGDIVDSA